MLALTHPKNGTNDRPSIINEKMGAHSTTKQGRSSASSHQGKVRRVPGQTSPRVSVRALEVVWGEVGGLSSVLLPIDSVLLSMLLSLLLLVLVLLVLLLLLSRRRQSYRMLAVVPAAVGAAAAVRVGVLERRGQRKKEDMVLMKRTCVQSAATPQKSAARVLCWV